MSRWRTGVTAAAVLPSALGAALLVSAPFAGTTTAPLADSHNQAAVRHVSAAAPHRSAALAPMRFDVPARALVTLVGAEVLLVGVGAGVIVVARKQRATEARA